MYFRNVAVHCLKVEQRNKLFLNWKHNPRCKLTLVYLRMAVKQVLVGLITPKLKLFLFAPSATDAPPATKKTTNGLTPKILPKLIFVHKNWANSNDA